MENIIKHLEEQFWKELEESEGITKDDLDLVDLEIGFSPVVPFKGDSTCEVIETIGGKYQVMHPLFKEPITAEYLKVMRYRYLSNRKNPFKF